MTELTFIYGAEAIKLGWPVHLLSKALRSIPRRHVNPIVTTARLVGRSLKHIYWSDPLSKI